MRALIAFRCRRSSESPPRRPRQTEWALKQAFEASSSSSRWTCRHRILASTCIPISSRRSTSVPTAPASASSRRCGRRPDHDHHGPGEEEEHRVPARWRRLRRLRRRQRHRLRARRSKSRREGTSKWIQDERDPERRRRMQRELDDLRRDRERENRRREAESRDLTARKQSEIASKRLDAGSASICGSTSSGWRRGCRRLRDAADAVAVRRFQRRPGGPSDGRREHQLPPPPRARRSLARHRAAPRHVDERRARHARRPEPQQGGKQGELTTITEWCEDADRVTRSSTSAT